MYFNVSRDCIYCIRCHFGSWGIWSFIIAFEAFVAQNHNQPCSVYIHLEQAGRGSEGSRENWFPWSSQLQWSHRDSVVTDEILLPRVQDQDLLEDFWVSRQFLAVTPLSHGPHTVVRLEAATFPDRAGALSSCWAGFLFFPLLNCLVYCTWSILFPALKAELLSQPVIEHQSLSWF